MASIMNSSNWHGPNAAGCGRTPSPAVADDGTGLKGALYTGDAVKGKVYVRTGSNTAGAVPTSNKTSTVPLNGKREK